MLHLVWCSAMAQFGPAQTLLTASGLPRLEAVDVDGDGDLDLLGHFGEGGIKWAENVDGQDALADFALLVPATAEGAFKMAELSGDGLLDIAYLDGNEVKVAFNSGSGIFAAPMVVETLAAPAGALELSDITGDGARDIVLTIEQGAGSRIAYHANEGGAFGPQVLLAPAYTGAPSTILLAGDLDGSGSTDLFFITEDNAAIGLISSGGTWDEIVLFNLFDYPFERPRLLDVDGDGDLDVAEAHAMVVQWADNRINEQIPFNAFTLRVVEPFVTAGIGAFGDLGCGEGASVVFIPSDPTLAVRWSTYLPSTQRFAPRQQLPDLPRGEVILFADMDGDGANDLLIADENGLHLFSNQLQAPTTMVEIPALDTVCVNGPSIVLPQGTPGDGVWQGTFVNENIFHRASVGGTSTVPLAYTVYEPQGCPVGAPGSIRVISGPTIVPFLGPVVCSGDGPFVMNSLPVGAEWFGLGDDNILDLDEYSGEQIVAAYTDFTGSTCVSFMGPLNIWNTLDVEIQEPGPLCFNDGPQLIVTSTPWTNDQWSGAISSFTQEGALFDPSQGAGTYTVIVERQPNAPQQCAGMDTVTIVVSDEIPEVELTQPPAYCASTSSIGLDFNVSEGGYWSGPGVSGDILLPFIAGTGDHTLSYTIDAPNGCSNTEQITLTLASIANVSHPGLGGFSFCVDQDPIQLSAYPAGGVWGAPVGNDGIFDPAAAGVGEHELSYTYVDPNGCQISNPAATIQVHEEETEVTIQAVGSVCQDDPPFDLIGTPGGIWHGDVTGIGDTIVFDPQAMGVGTHTVMLTSEAEGTCPATATMEIMVEVCTGMELANAHDGITLAPNPTNGLVRLNLSETGDRHMELLDAAGRVVRPLPMIRAGMTVVDVDLSTVADGLYHLRIVGDAGPVLLRVVKQ